MGIKRLWVIPTCAALSFSLTFGGVAGLITAFDLEIALRMLAVLCLIGAFAGSIAGSFRRGGSVLLCALALLAGYLWRQGDFADEFSYLLFRISTVYDSILHCGYIGTADHAQSLTLALSASSALLAIVSGWCLSRGRHSVLLVLLSALPLIPCFVVNHTLPHKDWLFLFLLGLALVVLSQSIRRRDSAEASRLTLLLTVPVALALILLFFAYPQSKYDPMNHSDKLRSAVMQLLDQISTDEATFKEKPPIQSTAPPQPQVNLRHVGPNRQFGFPVMEVSSEQGGTLYLRGRDFDVYSGTQWSSTQSRREVFPTAYTFPLVPAGNLLIRTLGSPHPICYLPYYPHSETELLGGSHSNSTNSSEFHYQVSVLPADYGDRIEAHWDAVVSGGIAADSYYHDFTDPDLYALYTQLPSDTAQWAKDYLRNNLTIDKTKDSIYTTANAIAAFVRNSAPYDRNTPHIPRTQEDFARWFLESSDTGYCIHFATATTVLLRAAGIMARYVEGYMINAAPGETVTVTDGDAHAWAEYYIPSVGWVPLESSGSSNSETIPESLPATATTGSDASTPTESQANKTTADTTNSPDPDKSDRPQSPTGIFIPCLSAATATLLLQWPLRLFLRKKWQKLGNTNVRALKKWSQIHRLARLAGCAMPQELEALALRAKFSQHTLTEEELSAFDLFQRQVVTLLRSRPWYLQLYYRYVWAAY